MRLGIIKHLSIAEKKYQGYSDSCTCVAYPCSGERVRYSSWNQA